MRVSKLSWDYSRTCWEGSESTTRAISTMLSESRLLVSSPTSTSSPFKYRVMLSDRQTQGPEMMTRFQQDSFRLLLLACGVSLQGLSGSLCDGERRLAALDGWQVSTSCQLSPDMGQGVIIRFISYVVVTACLTQPTEKETDFLTIRFIVKPD